MSTSQIIWKGIKVGLFKEESMDMGYSDGIMTSNDSTYAKQFVKLASELDFKTVMLNPQNGFRAHLKDEAGFLINVLVMGITEKMELSLKMIVGKQELIDWFLKNVPEDKLLTKKCENNREDFAKTKDTNNNKLWSKLKNLWS